MGHSKLRREAELVINVRSSKWLSLLPLKETLPTYSATYTSVIRITHKLIIHSLSCDTLSKHCISRWLHL